MRADRLISILMLLQTRGQMTAQELADRLEVSSRTIYRDLDALSAAGVPVYAERGPHGGCSLLESYRTNLTGLKESEVRALFLFTVPGLLADLNADAAAEAALLKLSAALPAPFRRDADLARRRIFLDPRGWLQFDEPTPHLAVIQEALWHEKRLRMTYRRARGTWGRYLVDPYGLVAKAGVWYLIAASYGKAATYRISRVQEAAITEHGFTYPADFDLAAFWTEWVAQFEAGLQQYHVTLRVAPPGIPTLVQSFGEGVHHRLSESGMVDDDGWCQISLTCESADAAARRILTLDTVVEIVEPPELRQLVADKARQLWLHHQGVGKAR